MAVLEKLYRGSGFRNLALAYLEISLVVRDSEILGGIFVFLGISYIQKVLPVMENIGFSRKL